VLAASRRNLVGGLWPDGKIGYEWVLTYENLPKGSWVLEKWLSPGEFAGSKEDWDLLYRDPATGFLLLGPYPDRGEYQMVFTLDQTDVSQFNLEEIIKMIEHGKSNSAQSVKDACRRAYEKEEAAKDAIIEGTLRERLPAFGVRPMFSSAVGRGEMDVGDVAKRMAPPAKKLIITSGA
jgi:hypothetical protein